MSEENRSRNRVVDGVEVAPPACVVCHRAKPDTDQPVPGWTYLAGSVPVGAITCSERCLEIAMRRWRLHNRVDTPGHARPAVIGP